MTGTLEERVEALERQLAELRLGTAGVRPPEMMPGPTRDARYWPPVSPVPTPFSTSPLLPLASVARRPGRSLDLERLLGGRLLALVGGVAVLVGIAFFVALAVNHGWIGPTARVSLAGAGSAGLVIGGVWLYERKGRLQAALALVGTGIAGLFLSLTAATAGYDLVPEGAALPLAVVIGALATVIAVRWDTQTVAGLGIGGTLAAPALGQALTTSGMAFLAVASASAAAVLVWRRWQWLAVGAAILTLAQVAWWVLGGPSPVELVIVLSGFAALNLALALGHELRDPDSTLRPAAVLLIPFGALVLGPLGFFALPHGPGHQAGGAWVLGLAAAHGVIAVAARASRRVSVEVGYVLAGAAVVLADVAAAVLGHGWTLGLGWAASAFGIAVLTRQRPQRDALLQVTLGVQLALSVGHVLLFDARPDLLVMGEVPGPGALTSVLGVMAVAFGCARLGVFASARFSLDALAMASLAYVTALSLDGGALMAAWAVISVALARTAGGVGDRTARAGSLGFLGLVVGHLLSIEAPPSALVDGMDSLPAAALALVLVAAVAELSVRLDPGSDTPPVAFHSIAALALLYLASTGIVDLCRPGLGQLVLSVFWAACGTAALVVGLRGGVRTLRLGGLGLLSLAATKVFLYDLGALRSAYRVGSFIGLGLLLLAGAYAYQRLQEGARPVGSDAEPGRP